MRRRPVKREIKSALRDSPPLCVFLSRFVQIFCSPSPPAISLLFLASLRTKPPPPSLASFPSPIPPPRPDIYFLPRYPFPLIDFSSFCFLVVASNIRAGIFLLLLSWPRGSALGGLRIFRSRRAGGSRYLLAFRFWQRQKEFCWAME